MIPIFDKKLLRLTSLAFIVPSSMAVGYGLGYLLDKTFSTESFRFAGIFLGIVAGFYELVKEIIKYNRNLDGKGD